MIWTDAMLARLAKLQQDGERSYGQIAARLSAEFSVKLTKNACIGKAARLGLPQRRTITRAPKRKPRKLVAVAIPEEAVPRVLHWPVTPLPEPVAGQLTIYHLERGKCHFPHGDRPPYVYCGETVQRAGSSWCPMHERIVYPRGMVRQAAAVA